jgi:alpha-tubulin suppressor-like RCC1 family protein
MKILLLTLSYCLLILLLTNSNAYSQNTQLTGGNNFSVGLCSNGAIFAWGTNGSGQIGLNSSNVPYPGSSYTTPQQVFGPWPAGTKFTQVNAGSGAHALALTCAGNVYVWGENKCGQVGDGLAVNTATCAGAGSVPHPTPQEVVGVGGVGFLSGVKYISGGNNVSLAILNTGELVAWGQNANGQLGNNGTINSSSPVYVQKCSGGNLTNVVQVQGGDETVYALDASGQVWSWGENNPSTGTNVSLGRTVAGLYSACADKVVKASGAPLKGIVMIAAGDTHGLALDSSGQVWSWGGDWSPGQLGQGANYVSNSFASRVVSPNNFTATTNATGVSSGPFLTGVVYIGAGQASSVAVLANGNVVSWGGLGLYSGCASGQLLFSGTLGNGGPLTGTTCQSNAVRCSTGVATPAGCAGYGTPVYVETAAGVNLTNIISVARGDGWYFAIDKTGNTYTWGYNGAGVAASGGELGIGNTVDQNYAVPVSLPTGCGTVSSGCPTKPSLGPDYKICPANTTTLSSSVVGAGFTYTWLYSATGATGSYTNASGPTLGVPGATFTTSVGYYVVQISANNACGPCVTVYDTIQISPIPAPFSGSGNFCATPAPGNGTWTVTGSNHVKWYQNASGGTALNSTNDNPAISLADLSLANNTYCAGGYTLFAQDVSSYGGTLRPTSTLAGAPCSGAGAQEQGQRSPMKIVVYNNLVIDTVGFILPSFGFNFTKNYMVKIFANAPGSGPYCGTCSAPLGNQDGPAAAPLYTSPTLTITGSSGNPSTLEYVTTNYALTGTASSPGIYWIEVAGDEVVDFNCSTPAQNPTQTIWASPEVDNSGFNVLNGASAYHDNSYSGLSHVVNVKFQVGSSYPCTRLPICATANCSAPINLLGFNAEKQGSNIFLSWVTTSEKNSDYYLVVKSTDGINWTVISKIKANGTSNSMNEYTALDTHPSGINYYKIVEYDLDGKTQYSDLQKVEFTHESSITVFPNPNNGNFNITIRSKTEKVFISLMNAVGQTVYQSSEEINESLLSKDFNFGSLSKGVYVLTVKTTDDYDVVKIVIE